MSVYNYSPAEQTSGRNAELGGRDADVTRKDATRGQVGAFSVLGIFTGEDERFAYVRLRLPLEILMSASQGGFGSVGRARLRYGRDAGNRQNEET